MTIGLRLDCYFGNGALVVRPVGMLTMQSYPVLRDGLLRLAVAEPAAMVVELDSLDLSEVTLLSVFPTVWRRISDWPGIPMVLTVARQPLRTLVESSVVPRFIPTYRSVAEALATMESVLPRRSREVRLSGDTHCGGMIRRMVEQTCQDWDISTIAVEAKLVASELTENVVRHAGSAGWLRLELGSGPPRMGRPRDMALTIAVADADPRPPRLCPPAERKSGGRGLVLVAELSRSWGYLPRAQGGKVVWARLAVADQTCSSGFSDSSRK